MQNLDLSSANAVFLEDVHDVLTGDDLTTATVTATLYSVDDETTPIATASLVFDAEQGRYEGTFTAAQVATLTEGSDYVIRTTATVGGVLSKTWRETYRATWDRGCA